MKKVTEELIEKTWNDSPVARNKTEFGKLSQTMRERVLLFAEKLEGHFSPKRVDTAWDNIERGDFVELVDHSGDTYILKVLDVLMDEEIIVAKQRSFEFSEIAETRLVIYPMDPLPTEVGSVITITEINEEKLESPLVASFHGNAWVTIWGDVVQSEDITRWADPKFAFVDKAGELVEIEKTPEKTLEEEDAEQSIDMVSEGGPSRSDSPDIDGPVTESPSEEGSEEAEEAPKLFQGRPLEMEEEDFDDPAESESYETPKPLPVHESPADDLNAWTEIIPVRDYEGDPTELIETHESSEVVDDDLSDRETEGDDDNHDGGENVLDRQILTSDPIVTTFPQTSQEKTSETPDYVERLEELRKMEYGWLDGVGREVSDVALKNAREILDLNHSEGNERPGIFPTEDGGVKLDWRIKKDEHSLKKRTEIEISEFGVMSVYGMSHNTVDNTFESLAGEQGYYDGIIDPVDAYRKFKEVHEN